MNPCERYRADLEQPGFVDDAGQVVAVDAIQALYERLTAAGNRRWWRRGKPVQGLYLWGGVGRGKTYLMDLFYDCVDARHKARLHFHRFMQRVHTSLRHHRQRPDPLQFVAEQWSEDVKLLCLDEFMIHDIADAMIIGRLLDALFERKMTLVTTSNFAPDALYAGGLQRSRFLPTIELLKTYCDVVEIEAGIDHRLDILQAAGTYFVPAGNAGDETLRELFMTLAPGSFLLDDMLDIEGRALRYRARADGILWCDFDELCEKPRGAVDYIELGTSFNTVLVGQVPRLGTADDNAARRFITLVDELYDRRVKLIVAADAPPAELYTGDNLAFEYQRTASRLTSMQSKRYQCEPHRPQ